MFDAEINKMESVLDERVCPDYTQHGGDIQKKKSEDQDHTAAVREDLITYVYRIVRQRQTAKRQY